MDPLLPGRMHQKVYDADDPRLLAFSTPFQKVSRSCSSGDGLGHAMAAYGHLNLVSEMCHSGLSSCLGRHLLLNNATAFPYGVERIIDCQKLSIRLQLLQAGAKIAPRYDFLLKGAKYCKAVALKSQRLTIQQVAPVAPFTSPSTLPALARQHPAGKEPTCVFKDFKGFM